jgi:preprotein translocase subunit YajC
MSQLIFLAMAGQPSGEGPPPSMLPYFVFPALFLLFYFLFIAPAQRKEREAAELRESLNSGDEVLLNGGMFGRIVKVEEKTCMVRIADNVKVKVLKSAIEARVTAAVDTGKKDTD